jgi:hypothetical protein
MIRLSVFLWQLIVFSWQWGQLYPVAITYGIGLLVFSFVARWAVAAVGLALLTGGITGLFQQALGGSSE